MSAAMGVDALPDEWLAKLELREVIETLARDVWTAALGRELLWERYPG